ncbi:hypothetical protein [Kineococcus rubinsiae]|uniref:hypothetical protein n=1 Tax=Kineococcus rubinsiae TaxID=2609562 RepID=UPI001431A27D|nr:hypothetical protein [Kineococcus rubinsiae]NIZ90187.1 hypothetical protein [Kineococcus rubinsiae]
MGAAVVWDDRRVRAVDVALAGALSTLVVLLVVMVVEDDDPATRAGSQSWWMLPVFLAATVPLVWWRRSLVAVTATAVVAVGLHDLLFGPVVRCGAGLPLAFTLAFLAGAAGGRRRGVVPLGLTALLAAVVLVRDTAAGPELLPVVLVVLAALWGTGLVARSRSELAAQLRRSTAELRAVRDERTALEVLDDRARMSTELETLLGERLRRLEATAEAGAAAGAPGATREALEVLEAEGRRTLGDVREVVGVLRGGETSLAPTPSIAHLDALLAGHPGVELDVRGEPRVLPASVELSAYRVVEHLLEVLGTGPGDVARAHVTVSLRFADDVLEVTVAGPVTRGTDTRGAVSRARERVRLHAGALDATVARGRARVVAQLPVTSG